MLLCQTITDNGNCETDSEGYAMPHMVPFSSNIGNIFAFTITVSQLTIFKLSLVKTSLISGCTVMLNIIIQLFLHIML